MIWQGKRPAFGRWLLIAALMLALWIGGRYYLRPGGGPPKRATLVQLSPAPNRRNMGLVL